VHLIAGVIKGRNILRGPLNIQFVMRPGEKAVDKAHEKGIFVEIWPSNATKYTRFAACRNK
jgi:hypothetical protein